MLDPSAGRKARVFIQSAHVPTRPTHGYRPFRELGFTQRRCESCTWCWAVWVDAEGNRIRSFRNVGRIAGVDYA